MHFITIKDCRRHTTLHAILTVCQVRVLIAMEYKNSTTILSYLPSWKARQLILMPKLSGICVYVYMSITVSYGHLDRGLEIVSVAIPMIMVRMVLLDVWEYQCSRRGRRGLTCWFYK